MALEINEIGIRMQIGGSSGAGKNSNNAAGAKSQGCGGPAADRGRNELVEECVRRVMQILKREQQR